MTFNNPIVPGFHPDPSVCRVNDDFYLVTSTFEYFPGIPIFHSKDLINWEKIGHCITRDSQLTLTKGNPNGAGIYAPTIRHNNGIFYVITTNVGGCENFFVTSTDPYGEWSDPVVLDCLGIDPSLYFEDNRAYYTGCNEGKIYLCEIDPLTGKLLSERKNIWCGSGGHFPEGPHLYKKDEWYYLVISEGGTELGHMITVARSKSIDGKYISYENNPILSNRSKGLYPIASTGHSDIFDDSNGNWWAVCLGTRIITYPQKHNLGRETMLVPVKWDRNEWPVMGNNGIVEQAIDSVLLPNGDNTLEQSTHNNILDDFKLGVLSIDWNYIYTKDDSLYNIEKNKGLILKGNRFSISDDEVKAWIGRRQQHHDVSVVTKMIFEPSYEGNEAGLTIYLNNKHHYELFLTVIDGQRVVAFRRQIGSLWKIENIIPYDNSEIYLKLDASKEYYKFSFSSDGVNYDEVGIGETKYLTTEVGGIFTGNYIALYASGNGNDLQSEVLYEYLSYEPVSTEKS